MSDDRSAVKISTKLKWQSRWTIDETGRHPYDMVPIVGKIVQLDIPNTQVGLILSELKTDYCRLNKYRKQLGQSLTPYCECGEETEHYQIYCPR